MRKVLMILLGIALVTSMVGVVSAANNFDSDVVYPSVGKDQIDHDYTSQPIPVTFNIQQEQYRVTIPSKIEFSSSVLKVETYAEITEATLVHGSSLNLSVDSAHDWKLKHLSASETYLNYQLTATLSDNSKKVLDQDDTGAVDILTLSGVHESKTTLVFEITGEPATTGSYADSLTFNAHITRPPSTGA